VVSASRGVALDWLDHALVVIKLARYSGHVSSDDDLPDDKEALRQALRSERLQRRELAMLIEHLKLQIARMTRRQLGRSSEQFDDGQLPLLAQVIAAANDPAPPEESTGSGDAGGQTQIEQIAAIVDGGGQVMIGTVKPVNGVAVAHDGKKTLAMLRRRPGEKIEDLLVRLNRAIAVAKHRGIQVDEINDPYADVTYAL
jgi:hypothetical protein